eukprot:gene9094-10064_t
MAGRKLGQAVVDWVALSAKVPAVAKSDFNVFRARFENLRSALSAIPESPSPIDWDYYKKHVNKSSLIESFEKQYSSLNVPYPVDKDSVKIKAHKQEMEAEIKNEIKEAHTRAAELETELKKVLEEKPFEDMTVHEFLADKPELKAKLDDDIKNHRWNV